MAPKLFKTLAFLIPAMHTRFWVLVVFFGSTIHEYFPIDAKQNTVMADQLCCHACPEHRCFCAPYASKRVFNANSCSGNYQINTNVTGIVPDIKKPSSTAGFF